MAEFIKPTLNIKHVFDTKSKRHFLNGIQTVYHCHHYTALYTQLSIDANETELLEETSEESFYHLLTSYYCDNDITDLADMIDIACQYYSALGLGTIEVEYIGKNASKLVSKSSHVESGWIKKWKEFDKPVNFIGCGYVSAMVAAISEMPLGTYRTVETESIVMGNAQTTFKAYKK